MNIFYFQTTVKKSSNNKIKHRNLIYLTKEYKKMIDIGEVKTQVKLARIKGMLRTRVIQILRLIKLTPLIIQELERVDDPLKSKIITERSILNTTYLIIF